MIFQLRVMRRSACRQSRGAVLVLRGADGAHLQAVASALTVAAPISGTPDTSSASRLPCAATAATASSLTRLHSRIDSSCREREQSRMKIGSLHPTVCYAPLRTARPTMCCIMLPSTAEQSPQTHMQTNARASDRGPPTRSRRQDAATAARPTSVTRRQPSRRSTSRSGLPAASAATPASDTPAHLPKSKRMREQALREDLCLPAASAAAPASDTPAHLPSAGRILRQDL
jgi:hypothetical protein